MKREIFLDGIDDPAGTRALYLAMDALQEDLPEESRICGCIHPTGGMILAKLQIFVDGQDYPIEWTGARLIELAQFIEGNLLPILRTWNRSLPEFFQGIQLSLAMPGEECRREKCETFCQMSAKSIKLDKASGGET